MLPLDHAEKMHQLPDNYLADALPVAKRIAVALGAENYNILQVRKAPFHSMFVTLTAHVILEQWSDRASRGRSCPLPRNPEA